MNSLRACSDLYAQAEHTVQELMHTHAERARQELMRALSRRIRNWCVHWAYASGTNVCTELSPFKTCWAYASETDAYPEHTGQELIRALSMRVRNWCARSSCASEIKWCLAPPKIKVTSHQPRKALWCKNHENPSDRKSHTWAPLMSHVLNRTLLKLAFVSYANLVCLQRGPSIGWHISFTITGSQIVT